MGGVGDEDHELTAVPIHMYCERFAVCANCFDRMFRHHLADQPDAGVETIPASESVMEEKSSQVVAVASATPGVNDANMDEKT